MTVDICSRNWCISMGDINRPITEIEVTLAVIFTTIVDIDMVDISTSMEDISTMEAGTNTPVGDIGEEAIIDDKNDVTTLG